MKLQAANANTAYDETSGRSSEPQYAMYTYRSPQPEKSDMSDWERAITTRDKNQAFREAEDLYKTKKFVKVEIKKQFFDLKRARTVDLTLKTFEENPEISFNIVLILLASFSCGFLIASAISYVLDYLYH